MKSNRTILAIESSCDETAVAILENGSVLSNLVSSQMKSHAKYGGVVPELASRMHTEKINGMINASLKEAKKTFNDLTHIAVTQSPGLEGSLLVGQAAAKTLAKLLKLPLLPINHLDGHIYATFLHDPAPEFPFICLIVSGGHTQLILIKDHFDFELIGQTRDDAAGEAFDKVARVLGLGYPGGPIVEKTAKDGDINRFKFPIAMAGVKHEFSFSGLKTAVMTTVKKWQAEHPKDDLPVADLCASFQHTVIQTLLKKSMATCQEFGVKTLAISGGVSANKTMKAAFEEAGNKNGIRVITPNFEYCTDNAAMIGITAYYQIQITDKKC